MDKKGFFLIEPLVVATIIDILVAVDIEVYRGYTVNAKILSTIQNYKT